jgi:hypothetical protein
VQIYDSKIVPNVTPAKVGENLTGLGHFYCNVEFVWVMADIIRSSLLGYSL